MSLLVTSCTMGKQPDRLLNKGPQYLRTRTNASIFGQHRQSAVELLAASKHQFYNIRASVSLDKHQDLAVTAGQHERYRKTSNNGTQKEPPRSKSEHDLTHSQFARAEDESDENSSDTSDDSFYKANALKTTNWINQRDKVAVKQIITSEGTKAKLTVFNSTADKEDALSHVPTSASFDNSAVSHSSSPQPRLTILHSTGATTHENEQIYENVTVESKSQTASDETDGSTVRRPVPLPRKSKGKPVPTPRKLSFKASIDETAEDSHLCLKEIVSSPVTLHSPSPSIQETPELRTQVSTDPETDVRKKRSAVETLTKKFTALSATTSPPKSEKPHQLTKAEKSPEVKFAPEISGTFTATPVFIAKADTYSQSFQIKRVFFTEDHVSSYITSAAQGILETSYVNNESIAINKGRKRCPDVSASARAIKRERRSIGSDISYSKPSFVNSFICKSVPLDRSNSTPTPKSEMSIESVDQAVYESEINAIPTASMEAENMQGQDVGAREVTRSNSSLSGKMEPQDTSPQSMSPTPHCSLVPRSHSDIGCCLESQHSRDSSLVSNHSRLSRASVGADLENFFNQMGLEKGVLEPMNRLRELQKGEVFDSMSSLDSHDATSICSTYSRSEQEWSDSQSTDRNQQQTSIVERNARIIKWLCNVRKAKSQPQKLDNTATGKA